MKLTKRFFITGAVLFFISAGVLFGQSGTRMRELGEAIRSGDITLTANGNGGSSGSVVVGTLRNNTRNEIRINVILNGGLYLRNSGSGQNMLATQIFHSDGTYYSESNNSKFIVISGRSNSQIIITAYCANFERDNPGSNESFSINSMPSEIQTISSKISRYEADHFDENLTIPIQLALWRVQNNERTAIARKFLFTDSDWEIATRIMNY
jgi:hypothetical protein